MNFDEKQEITDKAFNDYDKGLIDAEQFCRKLNEVRKIEGIKLLTIDQALMIFRFALNISPNSKYIHPKLFLSCRN